MSIPKYCPLAVVLAALGSLEAGALQAADATPSLPNIVLIISDDHGWTDYGFMDHPQVQTPHLDRLASQSLVFRRGYVPSSLCCPSLASITTGLYPHQNKITCNDPPAAPPGTKPGQYQRSAAFLEGREVMNRHLDAVPTLPRLLAEQGYASLQTGKWWLGDYRRGGFTHGMTTGQRHGDAGLDIGRKTMQPIFDFIREAKDRQQPFFGECFTHNAVDLNDPAQNLRYRWIVDGRWKLIVPAGQAETKGLELYDVVADPHERKDVAGQNADTVAALSRKLDDWWNPASCR